MFRLQNVEGKEVSQKFYLWKLWDDNGRGMSSSKACRWCNSVHLHLFRQKSFSISIDISMQMHPRKSVGILMKWPVMDIAYEGPDYLSANIYLSILHSSRNIFPLSLPRMSLESTLPANGFGTNKRIRKKENSCPWSLFTCKHFSFCVCMATCTTTLWLHWAPWGSFRLS